METEPFKSYLTDRYEAQMAYYSGASKKNQKLYKRFQLILIVLSAITPVCAALKNTYKTVDLNLAVILISSAVAILTTVLKTFNYHEVWILSRSTLEKLKPEYYYYESGAGPYEDPAADKEKLFITRVETILGAEHDQWPPAKNLDKPDK